MNPQLILFDLDDTLVYCNRYFDETLDLFVKKMIATFGDELHAADDVRRLQKEIDLIGVEQLGFTLDHFPQSLIDTYFYLCGRYKKPFSSKMVQTIRTLGENVYKMDIEPYPHMIETLRKLKNEGHLLYLYTGGVAEVQYRKVHKLKLEYFFGNHIHVARHKSNEEMERLLNRIHANRKNTWMIGNSLRTDIVPALEAGINAIYIPVENEWEYNIVEVTTKPKGAYFTIKGLQQLPEAINNYLKDN
jgi:putative hydrolase of the HAD superfamily